MKAAILNANAGRFDLEEVEIDAPQAREVLVDVKACGLCHTDLHMAQSDYGLPLPALLGHELAGIVRAVGAEVSEFAIGEHVVGTLVQSCGRCNACLVGRTYQCLHPEETVRQSTERQRVTRVPDARPIHPAWGTGGFAEQALMHENQLVKVPREVPFAQASTLGCGVLTGVGAVINSAGLCPGEVAVVIGIGGVGLNAVAGARLAGAKHIIAVDTQPAKEDLARKFGATAFVDASQQNPVAAVRSLVPDGADHVFEGVGDPAVVDQAIEMVRIGGAVYLIGVPLPQQRFSASALVAIQRQITLKGVFMGSSNIKRDIPTYADLYLQGRLNLDDLISREVNIEEINTAYAELKHGTIARAVITSF